MALTLGGGLSGVQFGDSVKNSGRIDSSGNFQRIEGTVGALPGAIAGIPSGSTSNNDTTSTNNNTGFSGGGGDSRLDQLAKMNRNPIQQREFEGLQNQNINTDPFFDPIFSALDVATASAKENEALERAGVGRRFGVSQEALTGEGEQLTEGTTGRQEDFNRTLRSALESSLNAFKALQQQGRSRFGSRSNVGQAIGELARKEFFKQQGQTQQEGLRGDVAFSKEFKDIGKFITQKQSELTLWRDETLDKLKANLNSRLADIQGQRGQAESAKAQARIGVIQDSINRARAVADQDRSFRQNLAIAGLNQLQASSGRSFTPTEINAVIQQYLPGGTVTANTGAQVSTPQFGINRSQQDIDRLRGIA